MIPPGMNLRGEKFGNFDRLLRVEFKSFTVVYNKDDTFQSRNGGFFVSQFFIMGSMLPMQLLFKQLSCLSVFVLQILWSPQLLLFYEPFYSSKFFLIHIYIAPVYSQCVYFTVIKDYLCITVNVIIIKISANLLYGTDFLF